MLSDDCARVADALVACGVPVIYEGKPADLSRWERIQPQRRNSDGVIEIVVTRGGLDHPLPSPEAVMVSSEALPESWTRRIKDSEVKKEESPERYHRVTADPMPKSRLVSIDGMLKGIVNLSKGQLTMDEVTDALDRAMDGDVMIYDGSWKGLCPAIDGSAFDEYSGVFRRLEIISELFSSKYWDRQDCKFKGHDAEIDVSDYLILKEDGAIIARRLWSFFYPNDNINADVALGLSVNQISDHAATESSIDQRLESAKARTAEANSSYLDTLHSLIDTKPDLFMRLVCEAILGTRSVDFENPFLMRNDDSFEGLRRHYSDLATTVLFRLDEEPQQGEWSGYISLETLIKTRAGKPHCPPVHKFNNADPRSIGWKFVLSLEEDFFAPAIQNAYELIYHGAPIYFRDDQHGAFEMLHVSHDDYKFMGRLGKHKMDIRTGSFPEWTKGYWFKTSDLEVHDLFFRGDLPADSGIETLRQSYRMHLFPDAINQEEEVKWVAPIRPSYEIESETLAQVERAIAAFPQRYPGYKTRPPKLGDDVRPWLIEASIARNDREAHVFSAIIREHFKL